MSAPLVVVRVKRRRDEEAAPNLVVHLNEEDETDLAGDDPLAALSLDDRKKKMPRMEDQSEDNESRGKDANLSKIFSSSKPMVFKLIATETVKPVQYENTSAIPISNVLLKKLKSLRGKKHTDELPITAYRRKVMENRKHTRSLLREEEQEKVRTKDRFRRVRFAAGVTDKPSKDLSTGGDIETPETLLKKQLITAEEYVLDKYIRGEKPTTSSTSLRFFDVEYPASAPSPFAEKGARAAQEKASSSDLSNAVLRRRWIHTLDPSTRFARVLFRPVLKPDSSRILPPLERRMDEAIWRLFREGASALEAVEDCLRAGVSINFQRKQSDLSTALMAAAFQGLSAFCAKLLKQGALCRLSDVNGNNAVDFAKRNKHWNLANILSDVLMAEYQEIDEYNRTQPLDLLTETMMSVPITTKEKLGDEEDQFECDVYILESVQHGVLDNDNTNQKTLEGDKETSDDADKGVRKEEASEDIFSPSILAGETKPFKPILSNPLFPNLASEKPVKKDVIAPFTTQELDEKLIITPPIVRPVLSAAKKRLENLKSIQEAIPSMKLRPNDNLSTELDEEPAFIHIDSQGRVSKGSFPSASSSFLSESPIYTIPTPTPELLTVNQVDSTTSTIVSADTMDTQDPNQPKPIPFHDPSTYNSHQYSFVPSYDDQGLRLQLAPGDFDSLLGGNIFSTEDEVWRHWDAQFDDLLWWDGDDEGDGDSVDSEDSNAIEHDYGDEDEDEMYQEGRQMKLYKFHEDDYSKDISDDDSQTSDIVGYNISQVNYNKRQYDLFDDGYLSDGVDSDEAEYMAQYGMYLDRGVADKDMKTALKKANYGRNVNMHEILGSAMDNIDWRDGGVGDIDEYGRVAGINYDLLDPDLHLDEADDEDMLGIHNSHLDRMRQFSA